MEMKNIKFNVEECDGYFVADAVDHAIVTQGKTWSSLMRNIDEAVRLHLI
jgi:predicted RNase H-like HicB family nuclease